MAAEWIDFRTVKDAVSMEMALAHYNVHIRKVNRSYLRGKCPLPTHTSKDSSDSFGVHTGKKAWACQSDSCVKTRRGRKGGNVLDFVAVMENCSIRDAALKLANWFNVPSNPPPESSVRVNASCDLVAERRGEGDHSDFNRPLEFILKDVDAGHPYIATRGITREAAAVFGVGYFSGKGMMAGRVVIPIHDQEGKLVAYAGRAVDGAEPKYKLPVGFQKSLELFNLSRARAAGDHCVIIVEGFFDCLKVHQAEYRSVVALMGSTLSDVQEKLLVERFARVALMLDGDEPGREAAKAIASRLMRQMFVKVVDVPDGQQPDQLAPEKIKELLGSI